jgi:hypothetical protein
MRELTAVEMMSVSGGELEYSVSFGPFSAKGRAEDFGAAAQSYGRFMPFSGIAYLGDLYQLMAR